jgi:hypothetical protein
MNMLDLEFVSNSLNLRTHVTNIKSALYIRTLSPSLLLVLLLLPTPICCLAISKSLSAFSQSTCILSRSNISCSNSCCSLSALCIEQLAVVAVIWCMCKHTSCGSTLVLLYYKSTPWYTLNQLISNCAQVVTFIQA